MNCIIHCKNRNSNTPTQYNIKKKYYFTPTGLFRHNIAISVKPQLVYSDYTVICIPIII